jgi:hypothetical protein
MQVAHHLISVLPPILLGGWPVLGFSSFKCSHTHIHSRRYAGIGRSFIICALIQTWTPEDVSLFVCMSTLELTWLCAPSRLRTITEHLATFSAMVRPKSISIRDKVRSMPEVTPAGVLICLSFRTVRLRFKVVRIHSMRTSELLPRPSNCPIGARQKMHCMQTLTSLLFRMCLEY